MTHLVAICHNFETAHRLPHLPGKCQSLHGHSWWAHITVAAPVLSPAGTVVEFGPLKAAIREWIDTHLDHGTMLGHSDLLLGALEAAKCKVFEFHPGHQLTAGMEWPTVENVAVLLARVAADALKPLPAADGAEVVRVRVTETHVNAAEWAAP